MGKQTWTLMWLFVTPLFSCQLAVWHWKFEHGLQHVESHVQSPGNWRLSHNLNQVVEYSKVYSLQCSDTVSWATGRASTLKKAGCWFVSGDNLTGALQALQLQLSSPPPSSLAPIKSRMVTFWYQLTQVHLKMAARTEREYSTKQQLYITLDNCSHLWYQ